MAFRESVSAELRFKIFQRDNFTCQYCGRKAPDVVLELDHIRPISKGGDNRESNLTTSCFDCNRGKKNVLVPQMEDETAQEDFEKNFQKYKQRYGYYTNYIAKVIRNETGRKPVKLYIDQFVKRSFKTKEDFCEFKKEFKDKEKAMHIIRTCIELGLSYKAYKLAFTDKRNKRIQDFRKNRGYCREFGILEIKTHLCTKEKGYGKGGFKNGLTKTVMEYFMSRKSENNEELDTEREISEIENYVDRCIKVLEEVGKEYVYFAIFKVIDNYFLRKNINKKSETLSNILPIHACIVERQGIKTVSYMPRCLR